MTAIHPDDRPTLAELGEPVELVHGSERSCHEGDCTACEIEQARAEAVQEVTSGA